MTITVPAQDVMARFFLEAQSLMDEGLMDIVAVARLRNALYGPSVPAMDVDDLILRHAELREYLRRHEDGAA